MHKIKYLHSDLNIENKRIILRTDFNVPIEKGKILDCTRIDAVIPFLNELMKKKSKVILISHLGRPSGKIEKKFSLKPVFEYLKKRIDINKKQGNRISEMTMLKTGDKIEPEKSYKVGGWASVNENTEGPPVWELVEKYIRRKKIIQIEKNNSVNVITG